MMRRIRRSRSAIPRLPKLALASEASPSPIAVFRGWRNTFAILEECLDCGLVPVPVVEAAKLMFFLADTITSAQDAQRYYGIPSSFLIAKALDVASWEAKDLPGGVGWFAEEAHLLATSPRFRAALPFVGDAKKYAIKLQKLGYCDDLAASDLLCLITQFKLTECDVAAILPAGEYRRSRYAFRRGLRGRLELIPAMDMRDLARMRIEATTASD